MTRQTFEPAATVVSIVPFPINEDKPGMSPGNFQVAAAGEGEIKTLLVKKCKHGVYLDENRPTLIVPTAPEEVAEAICFDYKKGQLGIQIGTAEPGLFWVPGDYDGKEALIRAEFAKELREAERLQEAWFKALVAQADDSWAKFRMRGIISVPQRIAAQRLKLQREWLLDDEVVASLSECPVCFAKVHPKAIVCRECDAVLRPEEYKKVQFARQAQTTEAQSAKPVANQSK